MVGLNRADGHGACVAGADEVLILLCAETGKKCGEITKVEVETR